jgi:hypothetical protein
MLVCAGTHQYLESSLSLHLSHVFLVAEMKSNFDFDCDDDDDDDDDHVWIQMILLLVLVLMLVLVLVACWNEQQIHL